ncbi:dachshund a [Betta splendens]|uniref:Dachshund a n=1 Tax=Betta splendens TaxID=158456 RepID=A0A6P7PEP4_BETSP|nr:dachshund a [Betta splendens]
MAGSCSTRLSRTSCPTSDPFFNSELPPRSPRLPTAFLSGESGRVPMSVNGRSGGSTAPLTDCKMVVVHGLEVASFSVNGAELICLPQVFELFLKHWVGGLHTVYTKLKRLHISPVVCTVEQVRVLRGLGAIQPGVNRCKLITRADFETLYRDCTNASSRPGRPPKRTLALTTMTNGSRLLPHALLSPTLLTQTGLSAGLTAVAMAEALKLQKMKMMIGFHSNNDQQQHHNGAEPENVDTGLTDLPFMIMPHPMIPVGLPPASVAMAMNQMTQLSGLANMAGVSQVEKVEREDSKDESAKKPSPCSSPSHDELHPQEPSRVSSSSSSSPPPAADSQDLDGDITDRENRTKVLKQKDSSLLPCPLFKPPCEKLPLTSQPVSVNHSNSALTPGLSSMETLLTNIQGLLKVAVDSARSQDKQNRLERKELKLELDRERDVRQTLQRQLNSELQSRVSIQKRLKKEKKAKRKLQEALDFESRRREQVEQALHRCDSLTDAATPESERENKQQENTAGHENRAFTKAPLLF